MKQHPAKATGRKAAAGEAGWKADESEEDEQDEGAKDQGQGREHSSILLPRSANRHNKKPNKTECGKGRK